MAGRWRPVGVLAAVLVFAALLRMQARDIWTFDLKPRPDALEYTVVADQIASGRGFVLDFAGHRIPSRYPPGTSLSMVPALLVPGAQRWDAYLAIACYGLLTVSLVFAAAARRGISAALFAAFFVAISPTHVHFSVLAMSEVPSALAVLLVYLLARPLLQPLPGRHDLRAFLLGAVTGLSALLRYPNVAIGGVVGLVLLASGRRRQAGFTLLGFLAGVLPLLVFNHVLFGAFWHSGYRYWEPNDYLHLEDCVSTRFLLDPVNPDWEGGNLWYYTQVLLGLDRSLLSPLVLLLAAGGTWVHARRSGRSALTIWGFVLVTYLFYACYFFRAARLLVVVVPLLALLAGEGAAAFLSRWSRRGVRAGLTALLLLLGLGLASGLDGLAQGKNETLLDLYRHRFGTRQEAAAPALPGVLGALPSDSLLVVDFPRLLLEEWVPEADRILAVADESRALHTGWSYRHDLVDLVGEPLRPPILLRAEGEFDPAGRARVDDHCRSGGRAFLLYSPRDSMIAANHRLRELLASAFRLTSLPSSPRVVVIELIPIDP